MKQHTTDSCGLSCKLARIGIPAVLVVAAGGCQAGYYAPSTSGQLSYGSNVVEIGTVQWDLPARDLDHALSFTDAGKLLLKSVKAHGGWDRWRSLKRVEYRRRRVYERASAEGDPSRTEGGAASSSSDPPEATLDHDDSETIDSDVVAEPEWREVAFDPRRWGGADDPDASLFSLPFLLLRGGYTQEHLGVEIDVVQDREFQKILFSRSQDGESSLSEKFVVYLDSSSGLLKQLLLRRAPGDWLLIRMSGWETVAGLRLATRRKAYRLEKMFQRPRPEFLVWSDTLVDIDVR